MTEWNLNSRGLQRLPPRMTPQVVFRLTFACIIVGEAAMLLWVGRKEWYFFDEWRLVVERVVPHAHGPFSLFKQMFRPDGEHVVGLPLTFFVIIVRLFGIDTYWPFVFVNILIRVATLVILDDICRRVGARRLVRLVAVAGIAFFGEGFESLFGQSIMFAGFTLIFCLLAIRSSLKTDVTERRAGAESATFLTCSILSSSYGFPLVAGVALFYLLTRRRRASAVSLLIPPVVFIAVRLICGGQYTQQKPVAAGRLGLYIRYVQEGLSTVGEAILGMDGIGIAAFIAVVAVCLFLVTDDRSRAMVISMLVAIVLFYFEASLSRSVLGAGQARAATRYTFFCGVLAVIMLAAAWGRRRVEPRWAAIISLVIAGSLANGVAWLIDGSGYFTSKMEVSRARLALGLAIIDHGDAFYVPDAEWAADLLHERLQALIDSPYDDGFMAEADKCYDHWNQELVRAGINENALVGDEKAALMVALSEHSLGIGAADLTFDVLVELARQNVGGSGMFAQFQSAYTVLASDHIAPSTFIPTTARCKRL